MSSKGFCPFSLVLFAGTAAAHLYLNRKEKKQEDSNKDCLSKFQAVFVLGPPGSGKGTQCLRLINDKQDWSHLSAGDLLRAERHKADSDLAKTINEKIASGQIVPSHITVQLLVNAMLNLYQQDATKTKFLIDGFPRSQGNLDAWDNLCSKVKLEFVLYMYCPEELLVGRLLERGKSSGRIDDNIEVIRKRFQTFQQESLPIVGHYQKQSKVKSIVADKSVEDVYKQVSACFENL